MTLAIAEAGYRPWLSLYGNLLKTPGATSCEHTELSHIQRAMTHELMVYILGYLDPFSLGRASLVCRQWRNLSETPRFWERACQEALRLSIPDPGARHKLMVSQYRFSWKRMFICHPHLRFDGMYAARNTYVRTGVVEFTNHRPVHLVCYYRYFRFLPDGTFLYRTSPNVISKIARFMAAGVRLPRGKDAGGLGGGGAGGSSEADKGGVLAGRYLIKGSKVYCALTYPNSSGTELRCRLAMRSSHPGAHDRLDVEAICTYDRETGAATPLEPQRPQLDPDEGFDAPAARSHTRGLAPCVFVTWEQVHSSPLNLPPHQMDFMIV